MKTLSALTFLLCLNVHAVNRPAPSGSESKPKAEHESRDGEDSTNWWLIGFTGALAVVGFLQWLTLRKQANWMKENVEVTKGLVTEARISAASSQASADTAANTVETMKENARKELRARVFVESAERIGKADAGPFHAVIRVKNFGKIPADYCIPYAGIIFEANTVGLPLPTVPTTNQEPNVVLPPGAVIEVRKSLFDKTFGNPQHAQASSGSHAVYVYGRIEYRDGFGVDRHTNFRLKCSEMDYSKNAFSYCESGNEAT